MNADRRSMTALWSARLQPLLARRPDATHEPPTWVALLSVLAAAAVYAAVAWGANAPTYALDEIMMIGNAKVIAGVGPEWTLYGAGFMPGLAVLLAPLWWTLGSAPAVYVGGIWVSAALALVTIWPLSLLLRSFGAQSKMSVVIASVVMIAPSRALLANYLLSEALLLLALVCMLVAAASWLRRPSMARAVVLGLSAAAVVLAHGRGVAVAVAFGLWCLLMIRRDRWRQPVAAATTGALLSIAAYGLYVWVTSSLLVVDTRVQNSFTVNPDTSLWDAIGAGVGQLWFATLAWPLFAVFGLLVLTVRMRRDPLSQLLVLTTVLLVTLSVYRFSSQPGEDRIDGWFYGRYADTVWAIVAAIGIAYVVRVRWPLATIAVVLATGATGLGMWFLTVPHIPPDDFWESAHVLGVQPWLSLENYADSVPQDWAWLSIAPTLLSVLFGTLAYIRWWLLPVVAALWVGLSLTTDSADIDVRHAPRAYASDPFDLRALPAETRLGADPTLHQGLNMVAYYMGTREVVTVSVGKAPTRVEVIFTRVHVEVPAEDGARQLGSTEGGTLIAWVYPGELQDQLDREGLLVEVP